MYVYVVVRTGVYMQGCFGVYSNKNKAVGAAKKAKAVERDDYHEFQVVKVEVDQPSYFDGDNEPGDGVVFEITHRYKGPGYLGAYMMEVDHE